ncbi:DnaD domain-containing protein [Paenibacillus thalictri]|uniref:DnaD domain protein n=1 Tax=Paenibacillus thalictri TaxID=2527873 RepID=A0A4Q9DS59_9BACL|nr:DnaD domain protein [Paenibacillus thalictri]TBL79694.1 DnaD domain protein [Paenibacillus thalictri]
MKEHTAGWNKAKSGFIAALQMGSAGIPYLLLKMYKKLKLTETDAMLLIHVIAFGEKEGKEFPTLDELQSRMSIGPEAVIAALQKLLKAGVIAIDQELDAQTGVQYERYNFTPLYDKLAECWLDEQRQLAAAALQQDAGRNIFSIFENEFGRPLTPMEMETISSWLDKDQYKEELILAALKEAVFAGKVHFKYIDRILLDWSRNRVATAQQAREHAQKFRSK